jgi:hypothetical protein
MILAYSQVFGTTCIDSVVFQQVCYFEDYVEAYYDFRKGGRDLICEPMVCSPLFIPVHLTVAVEVPQSTLPVFWVKNDLCP